MTFGAIALPVDPQASSIDFREQSRFNVRALYYAIVRTGLAGRLSCV